MNVLPVKTNPVDLIQTGLITTSKKIIISLKCIKTLAGSRRISGDLGDFFQAPHPEFPVKGLTNCLADLEIMFYG